MPTAAEKLSRFVCQLKYEDLSEEVVQKTKHLILDTLACAFGGYLSEPSRITRKMLRGLGGTPESSIIGSGEKTSSPNAVLANNVMVRYLDFNDSYVSIGSGHPSENIPTALSVGEREHSSGKAVLAAVVAGFEVFQRFCDVFPFHRLGWYNVTVAGFVTPLVAGKLLGLNESQLTDAVGIGGSHNLTLSGIIGELKSGRGQISMMKSMGYGFGAQSGITAALLAQQGLTGPGTIIESFNKVVADNLDLSALVEDSKRMKILDTCIKPYPTQFMTHSPVEALFQLVREHDLKASDVEKMHVKMNERAVTALARPSAFKLETRESADHSLPYCLAVAMVEGNLGPAQFENEQWKDPRILDLMSKMTFSADPELEKLYPARRPSELEIITRNGEAFSARVDYPKGNPHNPMSDEELQIKFRSLTAKLMRESQISQIIDVVYKFETLDDIGELMGLLAV